MRGTEVIAQETFTLTQEAIDLSFEGYGLKVHVPEGSLPAEVSKTQLNVQVSLSGQFQLPSNCKLLSAVYWIFSHCTFTKPITVEIQHCAVLSSDKQCSQLTFVHTKCTQKELPYMFKEQQKGVFSPYSSYGSLKLYHFSGFGIVRKLFQAINLELGQQLSEPPAHTGQGLEKVEVGERYCAQLYISKAIDEWKADFIVTKDIESCLSVSNYMELC